MSEDRWNMTCPHCQATYDKSDDARHDCSPDDKINRMNIKEFRELGYLQEVNRGFFHPLGLALETTIGDDNVESLSGIQDYRDDPEGMRYEELDLQSKAKLVEEERERRRPARETILGYWQQPSE